MGISQVIAKMLVKRGHTVTLTRTGDIDDDGLTWRAELASTVSADIFVSIHCNSYTNEKAHGTETWYFKGSEVGRSLAHCIQSTLVAAVGTTDRGAKATEALTVLRATECPAVRVELAFISNPDEREQLTDLLLRRRFAVGVVAGIEAWAAEQKNIDENSISKKLTDFFNRHIIRM
jgi:N-acetylmuramoyl-L-alanine amidase